VVTNTHTTNANTVSCRSPPASPGWASTPSSRLASWHVFGQLAHVMPAGICIISIHIAQHVWRILYRCRLAWVAHTLLKVLLAARVQD
jgi:hypothetical protein